MTTVSDVDTDTITPESGQQRGRTTVTPRALNSLASALMAEAFGIAAKAVQVDLSDQNGLLALTIRTPIRVSSLNKVRQRSQIAKTRQNTILQRVTDAQTMIQERVTALTGSNVAHVTIRLNGVDTDESRSVT